MLNNINHQWYVKQNQETPLYEHEDTEIRKIDDTECYNENVELLQPSCPNRGKVK